MQGRAALTPGHTSGEAMAWLPGRTHLSPVVALPTLSAVIMEGQDNSTEFLSGSGSREHSRIHYLSSQQDKADLHMGPSSDRQSKAQTPVVPRVAQTWRQTQEVNVGKWLLGHIWLERKFNHRYYLPHHPTRAVGISHCILP